MLTGTLKRGARIEAIPDCSFSANRPTTWGCSETARYRVIFPDGDVFYACEEHAQQLWDEEEAPGDSPLTDTP